MYLKALEIQGFKSFPDRTKLRFTNGLTAVVGPNGSGKSNISDAVRWVLGEQSTRTLRGAKMEDVIFGGTQQRRAMGFAQVTLYIDNADGGLPLEAPEVAVTRKLYRTGESEYRINDQNVRLRDVHELFMDTGLGRDGYSIIGQGRIAEIIEAKSGSRREIFEEAAGIAKFRFRKTEAERKLAAAQENLLRLRDILSELEDRVGPLKQQAEKAAAFVELAGQKKTLELSIWVDQLDRMRSGLREQEDQVLRSQAAHAEAEQELEEIGREAEAVFAEVSRCTVVIEELRASIRAREENAATARSQAAVWENDIFHNRESIARISGEIQSQEISGQQLELQAAALRESVETAEREASERSAQVDALSARLAALLEQEQHGAADLEAGRQSRAELALRLSETRMGTAAQQSQLAETIARAAALGASREEQEQKSRELTQERQNCVELLESIDANLQSLDNMAAGLSLKRQGREEKLAALDQELHALGLRAKEKSQKAAILEGLEQAMEGYAGSVRFVLQQAGRGALGGVHSAVSKLIEVDSAHLTAIEVALGGALQHIIVDTDADAKRAIARLKDSKAGRATFLPLSTIKGSRLEERQFAGKPGFVAAASDLVRCETRYRAVVESLLGRVAVAEDLDAAVRLAHQCGNRYRVVTLDGQLVNVGGSMTGGSLAKSAGILSRQSEIDRLHAQAKEIEAQAAAIEVNRKAVAEELSALGAQVLALESERKAAAEDRIRYESELKRVERSAADLSQNRQDAQRQQQRLEERVRELREAIQNSQAAAGALVREQAEAERQERDRSERFEAARQEREELAGQRGKLELERLSRTKDAEGLRRSLEELSVRQSGQEERSRQYWAEIAALEEKNRAISGQIERQGEQLKQLAAQTAAAQTEIAGLQQRRMQHEQQATEIRAREKDAAARKETLARGLARVEEKKLAMQGEYDLVIARMWDEYEVTRSEAQQLAQPLEDAQAAQRRLGELKASIRALGTVNLEAIDEYEQVSGRYRFLKAQVEDVERSRDQLHQIISDLTVRMRALFSDSFRQINENFGRVFADLFGGGQASLTLTDGSDVLESGVDIHVQPPGKLIKNLSALSGGEQAFVAIAIYFAILLMRPAPFCLLDEIEAALDDINVVKFAQYLRRLGGETQFIAITHRRGTMEEADVLYGVTMQEEGVSKLLELSVSEVESRLGLK